MPGIRLLNSARTGRTKRPSRVVIRASDRSSAEEVRIRCRESLTRLFSEAIFFLHSFSSGEASSAISSGPMMQRVISLSRAGRGSRASK